MLLIFDIPSKPTYKNQVVFGVSIPLLGELTVNEAIAVDKAIVTDIKPESTNTEWKIVQVTAWLIVRFNLVNKAISELREKDPDAVIDTAKIQQKIKGEITAQLYKSVLLIEALWLTFDAERSGITDSYELDEPVTEGKETDDTVPSLTSKKNGTKSTSNSHQVSLAQNLAMDLDSNE
jgi:hypothetical protein